MKEQKNIDRLFQERFKDFEAHPSPEVWAKIKDRLDQKKKRKVIPLWWKLGGAAALLALLFFVGNLYFAPSSNFPQKNDPQFVTTDSTETRQEERIAQPNSDQDSVNDAVGSNMDQEAEKTAKTVQNQAKRPLNRAFLLPKRFQLPIQIPPTAKTNPQQIRFIIQKRLRKQ